MKHYNKLVRDGIPAAIEAEGRRCSAVVMDEAEYVEALLQKLVEEAREVAAASEEERAAELADLYEVIDALLAHHGWQEVEIRALQARRRAERGGFSKRLKLVWAD
jgi:predicted house-cleaning noncanonical NTP pyrophosphatase (MazG superfamily)